MGQRPFVFCLVARERASELLGPLREHFVGDPRVAVLVERRALGADRRATSTDGGGERRAPAVARDIVRALPAGLRAEAHHLRFLQRLEPVRRTHQETEVAQLVEQSRAGDPEAVTELWWRHFEHVRRRLRLRLGDAVAADAAAGDVLGCILDELERYDAQTQSLSHWLDEIVDRYVAGRAGR